MGRFTTIDPMAEKYYSISPYVYCANDPIKFIDSDGRNQTDYRNDKGELLYRTEDGISNIIIIPEVKEAEFEEKLNDLNEQDKVDDPEANKEELYPLGMEIGDYSRKYQTGNRDQDNAFPVGYAKTYDGRSTTASDIMYLIMAVTTPGAVQQQGYRNGKWHGENDRNKGRINVLEPYKGLKNNEPKITLKRK